MKLFRLNKTTLNEVEQIPFKLERDIQNLVEVNTESVFNLKFIQSELSLDKYLICGSVALIIFQTFFNRIALPSKS